ncbi:MAG: oxidoreductase, partial [Acidobacteriota bacterium]
MSPAAVLPQQHKFASNPYQPQLARIVRIHRMVPDNYLFQLRFADDAVAEGWEHRPGQFVELSVIGTGEVPISISSPPTRRGIVELCVRRVGRVTSSLYRLPTNAMVG